MTVWITRSQPGASRTASALEDAGFECLIAPVIDIEPTGAPCPGGAYDLAVFVSEHAARLAQAAHDRWQAGNVIGIGAPAVDELRAARGGAPALAADARAVVELIGCSAPARTLVAKGEGGREVVQCAVRRAGGAVVVWNLYRRVRRRPDIDPGPVSALVCSSAEGVRAAAAAWFGADGRRSVPVYAPSERAAAQASDAGFVDVRITGGAAPAAVATALAEDRERHG